MCFTDSTTLFTRKDCAGHRNPEPEITHPFPLLGTTHLFRMSGTPVFLNSRHETLPPKFGPRYTMELEPSNSSMRTIRWF